jgi:hypothetical protein
VKDVHIDLSSTEKATHPKGVAFFLFVVKVVGHKGLNLNHSKELLQELQKALKPVEAMDIAVANDNRESIRIERENLTKAIRAMNQLHEEIDRMLDSYRRWIGK